MKINEISEQELRARLAECDYPDEHCEQFPEAPSVTDNVIDQIRKFGPKSEELFLVWWETGCVASDAFNVQDITPALLRRNLQLKDLAVVLYYDWLLKNPHDAVQNYHRRACASKHKSDKQ